MLHSFLQRGGLWVLGQAGLMLAVVACGLLWHAENGNVFLTMGALVFLLGAAVFGVAGAFALGRNLTPFPRPSINTRLVQHGIYAWTRHPLYTAVRLRPVVRRKASKASRMASAVAASLADSATLWFPEAKSLTLASASFRASE